MGVRTTIQAKLIALFKVNEYEVVTYTDGVPSVGEERLTPNVICNETAAAFEPSPSGGQVLTGWVFDVMCDFTKEVDYSDFLISLDNMSFVVGELAVLITIGNGVLVAHPPQQGSHSGTQLRFNINAVIKK